MSLARVEGGNNVNELLLIADQVTCTAALSLTGSPTEAQHATSKSFVENHVSTQIEALRTELLTQIATQVAAVADSAVPTGSLMVHGADSCPEGYLVANGSAVLRADYPELFAVVGTHFGGGDGSTTFNLPDMRGQFVRGWDAGANLDPDRVFGSSQGEAFKSHSHNVSDAGHSHSVTDEGHTHTVSDPGHGHGVTDPGHGHNFNDPGHSHSISDPGHNHGVNDPGHRHRWGTDDLNGAGGSGNPDAVGGTNWRAWTDTQYTGISIASKNTGISVEDRATGASVGSSTSGVSVQNQDTGISLTGTETGVSVNSATVGVSVQSSGGTETRPRNVALLYCIKT